MSLVEALHAEHKARLARISAKAKPEAVKPAPKLPPPRVLPPPAVHEIGPDFAYEAAWSLAIAGEDDYTDAIPKRIRVEVIQGVVALHFKISRDDMLSARRFKEVNRARQVAIYLTRHLTPKSLIAIGKLFGGRDHATILHSIRNVESRMRRDPKFSEVVCRLLNQLKAR